MNRIRNVGRAATLAIIASLGLAACSSVDSGEVGLYKTFGEIQDEPLGAGLQYYNPFTSSIETMNIQSQRFNGNTGIYTSDMQTATVTFAITVRLDSGRAVEMRRTVGSEWTDRLLPPVVESSIKSVFGRVRATDAIANRQQMQAQMLEMIRRHLAARGVVVEDFALTNVDYSDAFEQSVERAQVAQQDAIAARNATVRIQEEANQRLVTARAQAEATRIEAEAISTNPAIIQQRAIEKWDGHLPQNMYGSAPLPFINGAR